jgi:hypothetical protein
MNIYGIVTLFAAATSHSAQWSQGSVLEIQLGEWKCSCRRKNRTVANALANDNWIQDLMRNLRPDMFAEYLQLWLLVDDSAFDANDQDAPKTLAE